MKENSNYLSHNYGQSKRAKTANADTAISTKNSFGVSTARWLDPKPVRKIKDTVAQQPR